MQHKCLDVSSVLWGWISSWPLCLYKHRWKHAGVQQNNLYHSSQWKSYFCFGRVWNVFPWPFSYFSMKWRNPQEDTGPWKRRIKTFQTFWFPNVIWVWFTCLCCVRELYYLICQCWLFNGICPFHLFFVHVCICSVMQCFVHWTRLSNVCT